MIKREVMYQWLKCRTHECCLECEYFEKCPLPETCDTYIAGEILNLLKDQEQKIKDYDVFVHSIAYKIDIKSDKEVDASLKKLGYEI